MAKVHFYYYQSSPRISVSHTEEKEIIPIVGDVITVFNSECISLNEKIKDKNYFKRFKVIRREFRMINKETFFCDVEIYLEPINLKL